MRYRIGWLAAVLVGAGTVPAWGQPAIAVQLPTFSFFSTNTTVLVPDRGSVYMGGVNRASSGLREGRVPLTPFAPFRNRATGATRSASGASVSVYIHDFEALDPYSRGLPASGDGVAGARFALPQAPARFALPQAPALSPDELARQRPVAPTDPRQEAENLYALGIEAQAQGNLGAAKVLYEMASRRASGALRDRILARLHTVRSSGGTPR